MHNEDHETKTDSSSYQDQIRADRACIGCGFNLFGQPVEKEEHYDLAITRCPECGRVASLQSYPTMSHWVNRFRSILASIWVLFLLNAFIGHTMVMFGLNTGMSQVASEGLGNWIANEYTRSTQVQTVESALESLVIASESETETDTEIDLGITTIDTRLEEESTPKIVSTVDDGITITTTFQHSDGTTTTSTSPSSAYRYTGYWQTIPRDWIDDHFADNFDRRDHALQFINREFLVILIPCALLSFLAGIHWSVCLLGTRKRKALLIPILASIIAFSIVYLMMTIIADHPSARDFANSLIAPYVLGLSLLVQIVSIALGVFLGRRIARFVVLISLPPRSRIALSFLWSREGLEMPKPTIH